MIKTLEIKIINPERYNIRFILKKCHQRKAVAAFNYFFILMNTYLGIDQNAGTNKETHKNKISGKIISFQDVLFELRQPKRHGPVSPACGLY